MDRESSFVKNDTYTVVMHAIDDGRKQSSGYFFPLYYKNQKSFQNEELELKQYINGARMYKKVKYYANNTLIFL